MKLPLQKALPAVLAGGFVLLVCLVAWRTPTTGPLYDGVDREPRFVEQLRWMSYDWRVRRAAESHTQVATNLGFVFLDEITERALRRRYRAGWPWPRSLYGKLVRELSAQGAQVVALDALLGQRVDYHPVVDGDTGLFDAASTNLLAPDVFLSRALRAADNVFLGAAPEVIPPPAFRTNAAGLGEVFTVSDADGVLRRVRAFADYRLWHPLLLEAAEEMGFDLATAYVTNRTLVLPHPEAEKPAEIPLTETGEYYLADVADVSQHPEYPATARPFEARRVWTLGIALAAAALGLDLDRAEVNLEAGRIALRGTNGVERVLPVDRYGNVFINWELSLTDPRLTKERFESLLEQDDARLAGQGAAVTNRWRGKLVVVGSTATGGNVSDVTVTPIEKKTVGFTVHWNLANSILLDRFVRTTLAWHELLAIALLGLLGTGLTWKVRAGWSSLWVGALAVAYVAVCLGVFILWRYRLPLMLPVAGGLLGTHVVLVTYQVVFEQRERRRIKSIFAKLVSPDVVNELLGQEQLALGGARRQVTVFFADVRGFTQMTDEHQRTAEEQVRQLGLEGAEAEAAYDESARETLATVNLYLATIADRIKEHRGTLDKYIGDCVMAFWGAPIPNERHAVEAVRAAIDSQRAMHRLNEQRAAENRRRTQENQSRAAAGLPPLPQLAELSLGTGINTGSVTVGLMGSEEHTINYTVFGREVNLASRLEGVSGRGRIIISVPTYEELRKHDPALAATCVALPAEKVKGISEAVAIFEVPWREPAPATAPSPPSAPR